MKKINLLIFTLLCSFIFTLGVSATTKSGNYFDCSDASNQCISCTYRDVTYYVKSNGKGSGDVAWKSEKDPIGSYGGAKSESASFSDFCIDGCKKLECLKSVYMYPDSKGTTFYSTTKPNAQNVAEINLGNSDDNGKEFLSSSSSSSTTRTCSYDTYITKQGSADATTTGKKFVVTLEADGSFSMNYDGKTVSNASSLANSGNITKANFEKGCPDIWVSCPTKSGDAYICSASTKDIYHGNQDPTGTEPDHSSETPDPTLTDGQEESQEFLKICDVDKNPTIVGAFRLAGQLINIAKIVVPILIIVWGMVDLSKAVVDGKDDAIKKAVVTFIKRVVIGTLVFLAPAIILGLFDFVTGWAGVKEKYKECIACLNAKSSCPAVNLVSDNNNNSTSNSSKTKSDGRSTTHKSSSGTEHGGSGGTF